MRRIVYLSTARQALADADVEQILQVSRQNNARDGITGLLAYHDGCFFQTVEGPQMQVEQLMLRVRDDTRHANVLVLSDRPIDAAVFEDWHMAFVQKSQLAALLDDAVLPLKALAAQSDKLTDYPHVNVLFNSFLRGFRDMAPS